MADQPALLKPSDVTTPLLVTPSEYCGNKGKGNGSPWNVIPKAFNNTATFGDQIMQWESSSRQQSHSTSPRIQHHHALRHTALRNEQPMSAARGFSNSEWLLDERVSKDEQDSRRNLEPIIPDVLKQLILSESKLKQNEKVLKEFEEQRAMTKQCNHVENPVEVFKPLPSLNHEGTNTLDEDHYVAGHGSSQDHKSSSEGEAEGEAESDENSEKEPVHSMECTNSTTLITNEAPKIEDTISEVGKASCTRQEIDDTSNDEAIAVALQEELRKDQIKQQSASKHNTAVAAPQVKKDVLHEAKDYKLALKIQEEFDEEMASIIQTEEKQSYDRMKDPSRQTYRKQPRPMQGYSLRDGQASVGYHSMHQQQQPDRELDRERRLLYLNRNGQRISGAEGFERSDSIGLSYEELYELKDVPHGYSSGMIEKNSSTFRFTNEMLRTHSDESEHKKCLICLTQYDVGDNLRRLHCLHSFHTMCIDTWLSERKTCPTCLTDIVELC